MSCQSLSLVLVRETDGIGNRFALSARDTIAGEGGANEMAGGSVSIPPPPVPTPARRKKKH